MKTEKYPLSWRIGHVLLLLLLLLIVITRAGDGRLSRPSHLNGGACEIAGGHKIGGLWHRWGPKRWYNVNCGRGLTKG